MESHAHPAGGAELWVVNCGRLAYDAGVDLQRRVRDARIAGAVPDVLLLVEHDPVYTRGRRADASELPFESSWYAARGIAIRDTDRGGKTTYHGPGQLVGYPIVDTALVGGDVPRLVAMLEDAIAKTLAAEGVDAAGDPHLRGVWTAGRKIASIGLHVSRGVTMHGVAINVDNDLEPFTWIKPCGLDVQVTSVARETGIDGRMRCVSRRFAHTLAGDLGLRVRLVTPAALDRALSAAPDTRIALTA